MNHFVHRMLGHYLQDESEDGADLGGGGDQEDQADGQEDAEEEDQGEDGEQDDQGEDADGAMIVTIGDEDQAEDQEEKAAPAWVKELRKNHRESQRENRELKAKLQQLQQAEPKPKAIEVGPEPTLENPTGNPDDAYDGAKFKDALIAWHDRKRQAEQAAKQQEDDLKAQQEAWNGRLESYKTAKASLKVKDFEDAEEVTTSVFSDVQRALIIDAADDPALVIYALGKNPARAKALAAITSHTKFLREISRLEDTKLKVQNRKAPPAPERTVSGTGKISGSVDSTLERLRAEAEKTGDLSKVLAYKRQQRDKKKG